MKTVTSFLISGILVLLSACQPKTAARVATAPAAQPSTPTVSQPAPALAQPESPAPAVTSEVGIDLSAKIPLDPSVRIGVLPNGMSYYIKKNAKPEQRVELRLAVKAGSILEDEDQLGLAHFVEHMAFNGSKNFKKQELVDYLESVGTRFGPDLNAYTGFDETVYMLQARSDEADKLEKGLLVMEDWASGVAFDPVEIDKERGVVVSEWRTSLSGEQRIMQKVLPVILHQSHYANRLPIGKPEIIEKAPYETVKRFYKDWYRPELMAVMAIGDLDPDKMEAELKSRFSKIPASPSSVRRREHIEVPMHPETKVIVATDKEAAFTQAQVYYKHTRKKPESIQDYRNGLLASLYNGMLSVRLDELAQKPNPPFNYAGSGYGDFLANLNAYSSSVSTSEGQALTGLQAVMIENERAFRHGFITTEFERQKEDLMRRLESAVKEKDKTESGAIASELVGHYLEGHILLSPEQELELAKKLLPTIDLLEINLLPKKWIRDEGRVIIITGPDKPGLSYPSEETILNMAAEVKAMDIAPYEDKVSDEPLISRDFTAVDILSEKTDEKLGTSEFILKNGVTVLLKKTDFKNDEILMAAYSPGGTSLYRDEEDVDASLASELINNSGLGKLDQIQLQKRLTGKIVSVSPFIRELYEGFNGNASPEDLELMFQLIYLYFTEPRKDLEAFKTFIDKQKAFLKNIEANPQFYFMIESNRIKTQNHPRQQFPTVEMLDKLNFENAFRIYQDRFSDASDFTFLFVGNFDENHIRMLAREYLGNLPSLTRKENWKDLKILKPTGVVTKSFSKGEAPKTFVDITYHGDFEWNDLNRYRLTSSLDILRIKLREALREDKGGVYGVAVNGGSTLEPTPKYTITISFNCDPPRTTELIQAAQDVLNKAREIGAEDKDIQKVSETQRQARIRQLKENRFWMTQLQGSKQYRVNPANMLQEALEERIKSLDAVSIREAMKQYLNEGNKITITMQPEQKTN